MCRSDLSSGLLATPMSRERVGKMKLARGSRYDFWGLYCQSVT